MAAQFDYDFFVIGGGSGGVRAARVAAQHGARVGIAEADRYGGTCVIRGCVPKKMLVYASEWSEGFTDAAAYGWDLSQPRLDWRRLVANMDAAIARLEGHYIRGLENAGATVYRGFGRVVDRHTVAVDDEQLSVDKILIATGARPFLPDIEGADRAITSNDAFHLDQLPGHAVVVGGGYIGVEFAHIFRGLGCEVTVVHRGDNVLRGFDQDIREQVRLGLERRGISLHLTATVSRISASATAAAGHTVELSTGAALEADCVLFATGREPNTARLGLDSVGVQLDEFGAVVVDEYSRTNVDGIFAVGDCTPRAQLTPVAIRDGHALADSLFGGVPRPVDHKLIPTAVFAQPPASTVGMSEQEARAQLAGVDIYKTSFRALQHSLPNREERVMMKLVVDADTDRVLGAHVVGVEAAEIIQCVAIAIKMGATKADFDRTIAIHPTTAEEIVTIRRKVEG